MTKPFILSVEKNPEYELLFPKLKCERCGIVFRKHNVFKPNNCACGGMTEVIKNA